ncbi:MAG: hypothetical protein ACNA7O_03245 [Rhodobacterales bacterium]
MKIDVFARLVEFPGKSICVWKEVEACLSSRRNISLASFAF